MDHRSKGPSLERSATELEFGIVWHRVVLRILISSCHDEITPRRRDFHGAKRDILFADCHPAVRHFGTLQDVI